MKNILAQCSSLNGSQDVKIRLRGRGSGHREGADRREIDEPLHLCVSAKKFPIFRKVCKLVEQLFDQIYKDYQLFVYEKQGKKEALKTIKKKESISTVTK